MLVFNSIYETIYYCPHIKNKFLIHQHFADKAGLHYDLRIEKDCTLKSWACRKLPDLIEGKTNKILAVKVEDHRPEWFDFKGEIVDGYGKGKVNIWDKGTYKMIKWEKDTCILDFKGTKLKGKYVIIPYNNTRNNNYLMFKSKS